MTSVGRLTAIEFGSDTCVLVRTGFKSGSLRISAVDTMDPASFPGVEAFAQALRESRRRLGMPRRARVVLWGVPEGKVPPDSFTDLHIRPLQMAGFQVDRIVSPCDALAALARLRVPRSDAPVLWLAVNRAGVGLVVLRPGEQLYARSFTWDPSLGSTGSQARLLQRYTQVSFLAPEVRQALAAVVEQGSRVDSVVTCGNLPDLRSLTMPLIEELDVEVETLDSFDGLEMAPELQDRMADLAPAIRLACAGALARSPRVRYAGKEISGGALFRAAALLVAVAGLVWTWMNYGGSDVGTSQPVQASPPTASAPASPQPIPPALAASAPATAAKPVGSPTPDPQAVATTSASQPAPAVTSSAPGLTAQAPPRTPASGRIGAARGPSDQQSTGRATPPAPPEPKSAAGQTVTKPGPSGQGSQPAMTRQPAPASAVPTPTASGARADKAGSTTAQPQALRDPLPRVATILTSEDRRLAMLEDGRTLKVGDTVGQRVVAAIEPRVVVFREPSGLEVRVGLGGRLLGVGRFNR